MMNKKLFTILFIAVFLIASIGFVSAVDDSKDISVKIIWDDANNAGRPDSITVNLIQDGKVVDKATLSEQNSWKTTFNVQDDGTYEVEIDDDLNDYSTKITGNEQNGFVITNKLVEKSVLGASTVDIVSEDDTTGADNEDNNVADDSQDDVGDDNETSDDNSTDDDSDNNTTGGLDDDSPLVDSTPEKQVTKKVVKKYKTKAKLKNTGLPIAGLVLVAFGAAFIPFARKKQ